MRCEGKRGMCVSVIGLNLVRRRFRTACTDRDCAWIGLELRALSRVNLLERRPCVSMTKKENSKAWTASVGTETEDVRVVKKSLVSDTRYKLYIPSQTKLDSTEVKATRQGQDKLEMAWLAPPGTGTSWLTGWLAGWLADSTRRSHIHHSYPSG